MQLGGAAMQEIPDIVHTVVQLCIEGGDHVTEYQGSGRQRDHCVPLRSSTDSNQLLLLLLPPIRAFKSKLPKS